ncbi:MAG: acyl-CoA dehydrogenase family protein [Ilumatobacteraceae bacterium]|jgi:alkylation response protein AidB-like acyl-CoA dehydrogenase|nr:MAG: acyl-CoA dehydrogenase [Acidimicrobium sp. BACL17 MAG-120924-bin0]MDP4648968.1 acyl-CoA dehydrogenase family protein [Ilumatobacteraceae bacterium]MDP4706437.1 acyl-CoA dehydrogenase family protein [Ilumatobacteraceae bacterium]MDP4712688.1 acyl-CoA dehydrogenase family protein [Ilumatobacteraceae bacterium]
MATDVIAEQEQRVAELTEKLVSQYPPSSTHAVEFLGAQYDMGLAWVHFPVGSGGLDVSPKFQKIVNEKIARAGGPNSYARNPIGYGMCGPTIVEWGTAEQKDRFLRPLFTGEEIWCQLFSEPGSGSDFAGLSAKGVRDGEEWIINGQKVWTTLAHLSKWGLLVVRTDADAVKHAGLTAVVVDMHSQGVEVRPLRQMTGEAEFNEVYFTDTRVPVSETLGNVGDGWRVSLTTLMNERVAIGGAIPQKGSGPIREAVKLWQQMPVESRDLATKDQLMKLWIRSEVARLTNIRAGQSRKMGVPGPEGSIGKMASADLNKETYEFCIKLLGAEGMLYGSYEMVRPETAMSFDSIPKAFLRARANSIEGGTSEVMRNILGERVLGLPGDVRVDREIPWSKVPRN